jgi:hypothetical protein
MAVRRMSVIYLKQTAQSCRGCINHCYASCTAAKRVRITDRDQERWDQVATQLRKASTANIVVVQIGATCSFYTSIPFWNPEWKRNGIALLSNSIQ